MLRALRSSTRAIGTSTATMVASLALFACAEHPGDVSDHKSDLADQDAAESPACEPGECDLRARGTRVPEEELNRAEVQAEHEPRVFEPLIAVPVDLEAQDEVDPRPEGLGFVTPRVDDIPAELTVVVRLADDAPTFGRSSGEPSPDDEFVTWFVVTEVIDGRIAVDDRIVLSQPLTNGFAKSDGFLRPQHDRTYVLMLDASASGPDTWVLAGGEARQHQSFLVQNEDNSFAFDRSGSVSLEQVRRERGMR